MTSKLIKLIEIENGMTNDEIICIVKFLKAMEITKEDFIVVFKASGHRYECGTYFIESENIVYSFTIGADGSIWKGGLLGQKRTPAEIAEARNSRNYLGIHERALKRKVR